MCISDIWVLEGYARLGVVAMTLWFPFEVTPLIKFREFERRVMKKFRPAEYLVFCLLLPLLLLSCIKKKTQILSNSSGCEIPTKSTHFGGLLLTNGKFAFKVSHPKWAKDIASQRGDEVAKCQSFLVPEYQEIEEDVRKMFDSAATKFPMSDFSKMGFGVVQALYKGYHQYMQKEFHEANDSFALQKALLLVTGEFESGVPFVAYAPLETLLDKDTDLEWTIVAAPPHSAFVEKITLPDGTIKTKEYKMQHWTCGGPDCRLTDIPGILRQCPSCATDRLMGQTFYDVINQAAEVNPEDYGIMAAALDEADVGCSTCGAAHPASAVKPDGTLTCNTCEMTGKPITDLEEGRQLIKEMVKTGKVFSGVLKVPKSGAPQFLGGLTDPDNLEDAFVNVEEISKGRTETGSLNFYNDFSEPALESSVEKQSSNNSAQSAAGALGKVGKLIKGYKKQFLAVAIGVPMLAMGAQLGFHESVESGTVVSTDWVATQQVESSSWVQRTTETYPTGDYRFLTQTTRPGDPIYETVVVGTKEVDVPESKSCQSKSKGNGFSETNCTTTPASKKTVNVTERRMTGRNPPVAVYKFQEKVWSNFESFTRRGDKSTPVNMPDRLDDARLGNLLRNSEEYRLGDSSTRYVVQFKDDANPNAIEEKYFSPDVFQRLDRGERIEITSSFFRGSQVKEMGNASQ
jgi:hypothetical protein